MPTAVRSLMLLLLLLLTCSAGWAQPLSPDAAVGTEEERLDSAIAFDSQGVFVPGAGFTARVRLAWQGTAGFMARTNYRGLSPERLAENAFHDARRSGFYNFKVTAASAIDDSEPDGLPAAIEYDIREAIRFGPGGRRWRFYVPVPRILKRISPGRAAVTIPEGAPESLRKVLAAVPPPGRLPVADVGRWTVRARYQLADGMSATAPSGQHIETDFAVYDSRYAVEGRFITLERTIRFKQLTLDLHREPELQALYEAVEADRRQMFSMGPATQPADAEAERLNAEGYAAIDRADFRTAIEVLRRLTASHPEYMFGWYNLCAAHLSVREVPAAITACERALELNSGDPYVRVLLGQAYWAAQRLEDTERVFREQVTRLSWSAWSLHQLAELHLARRQPAEAVNRFEQSLDAGPRNERAVLTLGQTYLELGRVQEAVRTYTMGLELSRDPTALNNAAYQLAHHGVGLSLARALVERSLDSLLEATGATDVESRLSVRQITGVLPLTWDTAGWVEFKRGHHELAQAWLRAAWALSEDIVIGEHLGDVLTSDGRVEEAARVYAAVLTRRSDRPSVRTKLSALVTSDISALVTAAEAALIAARIVTLDHHSTAPWEGEVSIVHDRGGQVVDVGAPQDGRLPEPIALAIRAQRIPFVPPPDDRACTLERQARVSCPGAGAACALVLQPTSQLATPSEP